MNLYLRTLGFSTYNAESESRLVHAAIKGCLEEGYIIKNDKLNRGAVILQVSNSCGLYIYGRIIEGKFIYEYYYPFVLGRSVTDNEEITIERHLDKESYAVICDELKTGVTLIFYLQNIMDYYSVITSKFNIEEDKFFRHKKICDDNIFVNKKVVLTALSTEGRILFPINKDNKLKKKEQDEENNRRNLIAAAKNGDQDAIESLTLEDIDTYTKISHRIMYEDVFTIVDSSFMPCGVECDQYSIIGEILDISKEMNIYTNEEIYLMLVECNNLKFTVVINKNDLLGQPAVGRRFKGQIWLQGTVKF